jgi:hypothetical protein
VTNEFTGSGAATTVSCGGTGLARRTYDQVAKEVGYTNRGTAHRAVSQALSSRLVEDVDHLRQLESDRLDALQLTLWPLMEGGDVAAANAIVKIISARIRLLGLDTVNTDNVGYTSLVMPNEAADG